MERLWGKAAPNSAGPLAGETGSRAQAVVTAYGAPTGDGSPQRRGSTGWGDGKSCPATGRCLWSAYRGWQPPTSRTHWLGGRRVMPRWWLLRMESPRGIATSNGVGPQAEGTGSLAQAVVAAYGAPTGDAGPQRRGSNGAGPPAGGMGSPAPAVVAAGGTAGDGSPQRCWSTGWGDGESCAAGGTSLWSACGGWQPPTALAHWLGERGVLPGLWSLPMERLWGTAAPNGAGPPAWGDGESCVASCVLCYDLMVCFGMMFSCCCMVLSRCL